MKRIWTLPIILVSTEADYGPPIFDWIEKENLCAFNINRYATMGATEYKNIVLE